MPPYMPHIYKRLRKDRPRQKVADSGAIYIDVKIFRLIRKLKMRRVQPRRATYGSGLSGLTVKRS